MTIEDRGAEPSLPAPLPRPKLSRYERPGYRPDRAAMWAVVLGLFLALVAVVSAHAAVTTHEIAAHHVAAQMMRALHVD